jgi:uncharacterized protein (DUF2236 family)
VRKIHDHVRGTDTVTGQQYAASDPALLLWVHATFTESALVAASLFGSQPAPAEADAYVRETRIWAELLGVPHDLVPADVTSLRAYIASVVPTLIRTPAAAESITYLLDPPGMEEGIADLWQDVREGVLAALPRWALDRCEYRAPPPLTPERRTEIRQTLGLLDAMFLGEPGVLEARQRIALRQRR